MCFTTRKKPHTFGSLFFFFQILEYTLGYFGLCVAEIYEKLMVNEENSKG